MAGWTASDIPDLSGRTAIVTGANSGLGLATAVELARHGAVVTLACRDAERGSIALSTVLAAADSGGAADLAGLDLASLASVREFATSWSRAHPDGLDILVNNAGVMAVPRSTTVDGFERQFATNHLGHFALTGLLLPALGKHPGARVVTVSSSTSRIGRIALDDLQSTRRYLSWRAYAQSKLANLMFALELQRRADEAGVDLLSLAAHPGYAATELATNGPASGTSAMSRLTRAMMGFGEQLFAQSAQMGALPQLYAATAPDLAGASFIGPDGIAEMRGHPTTVVPTKAALDREVATRLWDMSEQLTGVRYFT